MKIREKNTQLRSVNENLNGMVKILQTDKGTRENGASGSCKERTRDPESAAARGELYETKKSLITFLYIKKPILHVCTKKTHTWFDSNSRCFIHIYNELLLFLFGIPIYIYTNIYIYTFCILSTCRACRMLSVCAVFIYIYTYYSYIYIYIYIFHESRGV